MSTSDSSSVYEKPDITPMNIRKPYDYSLQIYVRTPLSEKANNGLCFQCNAIDFESILAIDVSKDEPGRSELHANDLPVYDLPHLVHVKEPDCPLCAMFCVVRDQSYLKGSDLVDLRLYRCYEQDAKEQGYLLRLGSASGIGILPLLHMFEPNGLESARTSFNNRKLDSDWISSRLKACTEQHGHRD